MNDEVYACYLIKDYKYQCKQFKDFIDFNNFYKQSEKELIIIPTRHKINYNRDELLKDEITKNINGNLYKNKFMSLLTKHSISVKFD